MDAMSAFAVSTSIATNSILDPLRQPHPRCALGPAHRGSRHPVGASFSTFAFRAGLVALRQTFVHCCLGWLKRPAYLPAGGVCGASLRATVRRATGPEPCPRSVICGGSAEPRRPYLLATRRSIAAERGIAEVDLHVARE